MASSSSKPSTARTPKASLPPRRGRVLAQIFESFSVNISSAFSIAGEALAKLKDGGNGSGGGAGSKSSASFTASPPPSGYASDAYSDRT